MPTNVLTDLKVRSAKPEVRASKDKNCPDDRLIPRLTKLSDGGGLQLWIMPNGAKYWRLAYRVQGLKDGEPTMLQKMQAIGPYPQISLSEARDARDAARKIIKAGNDPVMVKRTERAAKAIAQANTFEAVARQWLDKKTQEGKAARTLEKMRYLLGLALPTLGQRPIAEIRRAEVLAVLRLVEGRGKYETARKLRATLGAVFRFAMALDPETNWSDPTATLRGDAAKELFTQPTVTSRAAITKPKPFGALLRALDDYTGQPETKLALQLLALTFVRPGELRAAEWSEFELEAETPTWTIPAEKMKGKRPHKVPLAPQASVILGQLKKTRRGQYLFPSERTPARPMSENTLNAALRRLGYGKAEMCAHGFRSAASTMLNEFGKWQPDAVEWQLAHVDRDRTRRAYARGEYWEERVRMMAWWADRCDELRRQPTAAQAA